MAGDWIKIRHDLLDDPAVIAMSAALGIDEHAVVGRLVRLWIWADQHTTDGKIKGITRAWLDRFVGLENFATVLEKAGWLSVTEYGIRIPNFNRHMSQSAKRRALTARRSAAHRSRKRNAASVTKSAPREEKRREEKRKKAAPSKDALESAFQAWWDLYAKKVDRQACWKLWPKVVDEIRRARALSREEAISHLHQRTAVLKRTTQGRSRQFCPKPLTFLQRRKYDDDPKVWDQHGDSHGHRPGPGQLFDPDGPALGDF